MTVAYAPRALSDLEQIAEYLSARSPRGASSIMRSIERTIALIDQYPKAGRIVRQRARVRALPVGKYPYRVYYTIEDRNVLILHVRHARRCPPRARDLR